MRPSRAPRLRVVLLAVNVVILTLPLAGIWLLGLYETTLLQQTESELIAQAAFAGALYGEEISSELERRGEAPDSYGLPCEAKFLPADERLQPFPARLDRAVDPIFPPAADPVAAVAPADGVALRVGGRVSEVMRVAQRTTLAGMRLVNPSGVVVAASRQKVVGMSIRHRPEVLRALRGERVSLMRERISDEPAPPLESISRGTRVRIFVALPVVVQGRVWGAAILSRTPVDMGKALFEIRFYLLGTALVLLLLVMMVSRFTSLTIVRPVKALMEQAERVTQGERGAAQSLERPGTLEVAQLSEAIAKMAATLEERASYIDTFASNVAHEFKTPLTAIRGTVELLRDHLEEMAPEQRDRFLSNLEEDAERLDRLVSELQELARAEVLRPSSASADARAVVESVAARARAAGMEVGVEIQVDGEVRVKMARETLESVLNNIVDNARIHSGGEAGAEVCVRRDAGHVIVEVCDDGPGITEANQRRVFDRFFTTARDKGGSGLGLSIVKALVKAHSGEITLQSRPGRTVLTLCLPAD